MNPRHIVLVALSALPLMACSPPAPPDAGAPTTTSGGVVVSQVADLPTPSPAAAPTTPTHAAPTRRPPTAPAATAAPAQTPAAGRATLLPSTPDRPTVQAPQATQPPQPTPTAAQAGSLGSEILFLRQGALLAFDTATRRERKIADAVTDFVTTPDGEAIALVRTEEAQTELWSVHRDGTALTQLTQNDRTEATPSWSPDGLSLVFASAQPPAAYVREWPGWAQWCAASEVRLLNVTDRKEVSFGAGCDPAFSPDGRRISYAAPPQATEPGLPIQVPVTRNAIRLINRHGQNGWNFAQANGTEAAAPNNGRLVYAPAWSPDSSQIIYQRFFGEQALVDLNLSEIAGSFKGNGQPMNSGAGWLLPARFSPDGRTVVITENNYSDARGFGGYDNWSATVIRFDGTRPVALPGGTVTMEGQQIDLLPRGQVAAWSPDGTRLAVELPPRWKPDLPPNEPLGIEDEPGEVWLWQPGKPPQERLIENVDPASPLAWLPAAPDVATGAGGYHLVYPADWQLAPPTEFEERTALGPDGVRLMSAAPSGVADPAAATAAEMFGFFVTAGGKDEPPITWPDGSVYRAFTATDRQGRPIAGATRVIRTADGAATVLLYYTTPERWPFERALAQALLARSGPAPAGVQQ